MAVRAGAAMRDSFFRGRLAVAFAVAAAIWGLAGATVTLLGGTAVEPEGQTYVLSIHGHTTEVAHGTWVLARVCEAASVMGWVLMLLAALGIVTVKVAACDAEQGKDHSILVLASVALSLAVNVVASALAMSFGLRL
jgi:hypothetical protein